MNATALTVGQLSVFFDGQCRLHQADFAIPAGALVLTVGASGSGKSVLWRAIATAKSDQATSGAVHFDGTCRYVHQRAALRDDLSVRDNVAFAVDHSKSANHDANDHTFLSTLADALGLGPHLGKHPQALAPSLQKAVALLRALAHRPSLLIVDEPTTGLDADEAQHVTDALLRIDPNDTTLSIITHSPQLLDALTAAALLRHQAVVLLRVRDGVVDVL